MKKQTQTRKMGGIVKDRLNWDDHVDTKTTDSEAWILGKLKETMAYGIDSERSRSLCPDINQTVRGVCFFLTFSGHQESLLGEGGCFYCTQFPTEPSAKSNRVNLRPGRCLDGILAWRYTTVKWPFVVPAIQILMNVVGI